MVTAPVNVFFRVDAGPRSGLGHLQRCISLAVALRHIGATCFFLTHEEQDIRERVVRFGFQCSTLDTQSWEEADLSQTLAAASSHRCTVIVVDADHEIVDYLDRLRRGGFFVCAIDDNALHPFPCQLVVNGNVHARRLRYDSSSGDTIFLLGSEYSLLRREFWENPERVSRAVVQNVLMTTGGADSCNLMPEFLRVLGKLPGTLILTAICGPFFNNLDEVKSAAGGVVAPRHVRLVYSPDSVYSLMLEADLAISAAGQTLYELACAGCPTVAIRTAENQVGQLEEFRELGFVRTAARADEIGDAVSSLLADPGARASMSAAGRRLVDGQGALRVARTMMEK